MGYRYLALPAAALILVAACATSPTTIVTDGTPTNPKDASTDAPKIDAGSSKKDAGDNGQGSSSGDGTGSGDCASTPDGNSCFSCCDAAVPDGSETYWGAIFDCVCSPSVCGSQCAATACNPSSPSAPDTVCDSCANAKMGTACSASVQSACSADPSCGDYVACLNDSGCDTK